MIHQQVSYLRWGEALGTRRQSLLHGFRDSHVFDSGPHYAEIQESAGIEFLAVDGLQDRDGFCDGFDFRSIAHGHEPRGEKGRTGGLLSGSLRPLTGTFYCK